MFSTGQFSSLALATICCTLLFSTGSNAAQAQRRDCTNPPDSCRACEEEAIPEACADCYKLARKRCTRDGCTSLEWPVPGGGTYQRSCKDIIGNKAGADLKTKIESDLEQVFNVLGISEK